MCVLSHLSIFQHAFFKYSSAICLALFGQYVVLANVDKSKVFKDDKECKCTKRPGSKWVKTVLHRDISLPEIGPCGSLLTKIVL